MTLRRLIPFVTALLLIVLSWWGVFQARSGLTVRTFIENGVPMTFIAPDMASNNSQRRPGVVIAHGFTGSKQLMLGYGYTLAQAGYPVLLFDFDGHAANPASLDFSADLGPNFDTAYETLIAQPGVDGARVAVLGHSMGSGVVMSASIEQPEQFAATIAISPSGSGVTPDVPKNLQIQVGEWEGPFIPGAQKLLAKAGGENNDLAGGRGRSLVFIPNREHITILFSTASHQAALGWLNQTFADSVPELSSPPYTDIRLVWYGLHLFAWLVVLWALSPLFSPKSSASHPESIAQISSPGRHLHHPVRRWGGLLLAPVAGLGTLVIANQTSDVENLGGLMVGGALGLWFLAAGLVWLGLATHIPRFKLWSAGLGLGLFLLLWIAFGAMAQVVWLQWWLILPRLALWPLLALACCPWFLAYGLVQQGAGWGRRVLWWLGQSVVLVVGLSVTILLLPQLGFLAILIPVFPIVMVLFAIAAAQVADSWGYALGSALFFGWMVASVFPLAA